MKSGNWTPRQLNHQSNPGEIMSDRYARLKKRLEDREFVILDGGVGTELEKRGVEMYASWCGSAAMNTDVLKKIHLVLEI